MAATIGVNLIPARRLEARARQAHLVGWAMGLGVYVVAVVSAYVLCGRYAVQDTNLDRQTRNKAHQLSAASRKLLTLNQDLAAARQKLQTAKAVGQQPDWSTLVVLLAQNLSEDMVLDLCRLQRNPGSPGADKPPAKPDPAAKPEAAPETGSLSYLLELSGFAKSQAEVSDFVLRLEKTGLFDKVKLVRTTRQSFLSGKAVAFRLECTFSERGPGGGTGT